MKPEIKINQEPLSKAEIQKQMNFDKFISGAGAAAAKSGWLGASAKLYLAAAAAVTAIVGVSYFLLNNAPTTDDNAPFINPPVAVFHIKPNTIVFTADRDTTITMETGTTIFIPAGTFVSKDGKDATGKIELDYREFHDQVDLIFSGIPMHYDTAGGHYQFESAGMFEIKAKQNGEDLALKPGKEITVNMISRNDDNYFNAYYLDTVQRKWIYMADNTRRMKKAVAEQVEARSFSPDMMLEAQKFIEPQKADPSLYNFTIDYNREEFPELCIYDGVKFQVDKNFDPKLAKVVWQDVFIKRHDEKQYTLTFKYGNKSSSVLATPVLDEKDFGKAMEEYTKKRKEHLVASKRMNDSLVRMNDNNSRDANNREYNDRFNNAVKNGVVYRTIVVGAMGVWNCDYYEQLAYRRILERVEQERKKGSPEVEFVRASDGKQVSVKTLYLLRREINAVYPLGQKEFKNFPLAFVQNMNVVVGVTDDKEVLYLEDEELQALNASDKKVIMKLHDMGTANRNIKDVKARLKI